ncbi:hypothetical protein, partial [Pseudomonas sp. N8]|uniref:hypothetical protein n=1 Tax=Pseudomonas sp. N8 TaxID=3449428 RepID=UPI003F6A2268
KAVVQLALMLDELASSRARPPPQFFWGDGVCFDRQRSVVGARLLAKAVYQTPVALVAYH